MVSTIFLLGVCVVPVGADTENQHHQHSQIIFSQVGFDKVVDVRQLRYLNFVVFLFVAVLDLFN